MPATTNFLEWNPTQANQETDAAYLADAQRLAGVAVDDTLPSLRLNKMFRQWSVMAAALGQMMASKGYTTSDFSLSALAGVLGNLLTQADIAALSNLVTVAYSANPIFNAVNGQSFYMLLTGNVSTPSLVGISPGMKLVFQYQQDGAGGRTVNWPANVVGAGAIDLTPNARTAQIFTVYPDSTARPLNDQFIVSGIGYLKLPNGVIIQWGSSSTATGQGDVITFPIPFVNGLAALQINEAHASGWGSGVTPSPTIFGWSISPSPLTSFLVYSSRIQTSGVPIWGVGNSFTWIAIGS